MIITVSSVRSYSIQPFLNTFFTFIHLVHGGNILLVDMAVSLPWNHKMFRVFSFCFNFYFTQFSHLPTGFLLCTSYLFCFFYYWLIHTPYPIYSFFYSDFSSCFSTVSNLRIFSTTVSLKTLMLLLITTFQVHLHSDEGLTSETSVLNLFFFANDV